MATPKKSTASRPSRTDAAPPSRAPARRSATAAAPASARKTGRAPRTAEPAASTPPPTEGLNDLLAGAVDNTLTLNPLLGMRPDDLQQAARTLFKLVAATPTRALAGYGRFLGEVGRIARGDSELAPNPKDRRFTDPAWNSNRFYRGLLQGYLAAEQQIAEYIQDTDASEREKGQAQFIASLMTDALAPSNWLLGNPVAVRKLVETGGTHLVDGWKNWLHDMRHNHGMPSQVDSSPFKVGETVATSPGAVVLRHEMFELLQFTPTTPQVYARPLLLSPPQVNKYYAMDLTPEKSLIKWVVDSGVQMFVISWRNPTTEHRHWGLDEYAAAIDTAVDAVREITGSPDINLMGTCSGGMSAAAYLGWLAARGERKVAHTTWAVCVLDSEAASDDSTLGLFSSPTALEAGKAHSQRKGVIEGSEMAAMFAWLRPNDLVWNYWVNNYLLGNQPPAHDVLAWNADTTRLPGKYHGDLLDLMARNPYVHPGRLVVNGEAIDMRQASHDAYVVGGVNDHITPWRACYGTARVFGPQSTFVLANAGHLQCLINPPGSSKSFFYVGPAAEADGQDWLRARGEERQAGSWWPHWRAWLQARAGDEVPAPAALGSATHKPLEPAPGRYVFDK